MYSRRSIPPDPLRPTLPHRSQRRHPSHLVRHQLYPFCSRLLLDAMGAAKRRQESGEERKGVDGIHVEAEE